MNRVAPPSLKRLVISVGFYLLLALAGAALAIRLELPGKFGGMSNGLTAAQDFLFGTGTALSPPLYVILIQLGLLLLTRRTDRWGTLGVLGLSFLGLMTFIGALGEPINAQIFSPATFEPLQAVLMGGQILLSAVIIMSGVLERRRRRRERT